MTGFLRVKSFYRGWIRERRRMGESYRCQRARRGGAGGRGGGEESMRVRESCLSACVRGYANVWACACAPVSVCVLTPGARITLWRALCLSGLFFTSLSLPLFPFIPSLYLLSSSLCLLSFLYFFSPHCAFIISSLCLFFCLSFLLLWCRIFIA